MAFSKKPSVDLVTDFEERKALGCDSCGLTRAERLVKRLTQLSVDAIVTALAHSRPQQVFSVPYTTGTARLHVDALLAEASQDPLLRFVSPAQSPQERPVATSSPGACAENRRLLAEIRQELCEGNEDVWQDVRRLLSALATIHQLQDTIQGFGSQQFGLRRSAEGEQRYGSGLPADPAPEATSVPPQRAPPATPRPPVASSRPSTTSFRDELYEARRQTIQTRVYHALLHRLVDDIEQTLNSTKRSWEAVIASCRPAASPCSQAWMPQNLAMAVSRVYYYSSDYAEEIISAPLEVSGYTVRLAVLCLAEDSCVKLLFRAQFCFSPGNSAVQWPFRGTVEFVIHHPRNRASHRVYSVHPSQDSETIMPRNANNTFFYLAGPISALNLDQRGYWAMETLHLSVKVVPGPNSSVDW